MKPIISCRIDKFAVVAMLTTFDRLDLLERTLDSYLGAAVLPEKLFVFDDCSKEIKTIRKMISLIPGASLFEYQVHRGCTNSTPFALNKLFELGARNVVILDSDCLLARRWWVRTCEICETVDLTKNIVCLFNARVHPQEKCQILQMVQKKYIGGLGLIFNKNIWSQYSERLHASGWHGWDGCLCNLAINDGLSVLATSPSMIQHTGFKVGTHSTWDLTDCIADDFEP